MSRYCTLTMLILFFLFTSHISAKSVTIKYHFISHFAFLCWFFTKRRQLTFQFIFLHSFGFWKILCECILWRIKASDKNVECPRRKVTIENVKLKRTANYGNFTEQMNSFVLGCWMPNRPEFDRFLVFFLFVLYVILFSEIDQMCKKPMHTYTKHTLKFVCIYTVAPILPTLQCDNGTKLLIIWPFSEKKNLYEKERFHWSLYIYIYMYICESLWQSSRPE